MQKEQEAASELLTVRQFAQRFPAWSERSLRALIYAAEDRVASGGRVIKGNGLRDTGAVINCGRRILINVPRFFGPFLAAQQKQRKASA